MSAHLFDPRDGRFREDAVHQDRQGDGGRADPPQHVLLRDGEPVERVGEVVERADAADAEERDRGGGRPPG
jgi:hypothetical protein